MNFNELGCILFLEVFTVVVCEQSNSAVFLVGQILEGTDQSWMFSAFLAERWEEGSSSNFGGDLHLPPLPLQISAIYLVSVCYLSVQPRGI